MKTIIEYEENERTDCFGDIKDKDCFYNNGVLYMKLSQQNLNYYKINNVNAISVFDAILTFFKSDEKVNKVNNRQIKFRL